MEIVRERTNFARAHTHKGEFYKFLFFCGNAEQLFENKLDEGVADNDRDFLTKFTHRDFHFATAISKP